MKRGKKTGLAGRTREPLLSGDAVGERLLHSDQEVVRSLQANLGGKSFPNSVTKDKRTLGV